MIWTMRIIGVLILAIGLIIEQNGSEAGSFIGAVGVAWIIVFLPSAPVGGQVRGCTAPASRRTPAAVHRRALRRG